MRTVQRSRKRSDCQMFPNASIARLEGKAYCRLGACLHTARPDNNDRRGREDGSAQASSLGKLLIVPAIERCKARRSRTRSSSVNRLPGEAHGETQSDPRFPQPRTGVDQFTDYSQQIGFGAPADVLQERKVDAVCPRRQQSTALRGHRRKDAASAHAADLNGTRDTQSPNGLRSICRRSGKYRPPRPSDFSIFFDKEGVCPRSDYKQHRQTRRVVRVPCRRCPHHCSDCISSQTGEPELGCQSPRSRAAPEIAQCGAYFVIPVRQARRRKRIFSNRRARKSEKFQELDVAPVNILDD